MKRLSKDECINAALNGILDMIQDKLGSERALEYKRDNYCNVGIAIYLDKVLLYDKKDIRNFYRKCGFAANWSNKVLVNMYQNHVSFIIYTQF